jgi:hypothetical protein
MNNKYKGIIKVIYYLALLIIVVNITTMNHYMTRNHQIMILGIHLLIGGIVSIYLKLPMFNRFNFFSVNRKDYGIWDTIVNIMFIIVAIGIISFDTFSGLLK